MSFESRKSNPVFRLTHEKRHIDALG